MSTATTKGGSFMLSGDGVSVKTDKIMNAERFMQKGFCKKLPSDNYRIKVVISKIDFQGC